ncbi:MAG: protease complex subunit PrcB family protein [Bacteroidota bacterium]
MSIDKVRESGGYFIDNTNIVEYKNNISVYVKLRFPQPNELVTQSITQPCKIIRISKTNKPILFN